MESLNDLKVAILEFLLENEGNDQNTGQIVFRKLKERFGESVKRSTVYYNLNLMANNRLLVKEGDEITCDNNQPKKIYRYTISSTFKDRITEIVRNRGSSRPA